MYPKNTIARGESITDAARNYVANLVDQHSLRTVAEMAGTSEQTIAKALAGLPLMRCSRRRVLSLLLQEAA